MAQIEKTINSRNDPVDPSSIHNSRRARPFHHLSSDSLREIVRESSAMATEEDWAGSAMEDEELRGEYASSPGIEVDQVVDESRASSINEDNNHRNSTYSNDQKRSSHQADLVSSQSTSSEGEYVCRHKKTNKMKLLVRSHALREAASPPPDSPSPLFNATANNSSAQPPDEQQHNQQQQQQASLVITVVESHDETSSPHHQEMAQVTNRLRPRVQVESSQCSVDSSSSFVSFSLSRDSSTDLANGGSDAYLTAGSHLYTDNTGVDLHHFIIETLHRNYKDRMTLLRIEQDMIALVRDTKRTCHRFPAMSSYHRMLVHRVAAYFGMEHNVDQSGNCVVVSKSRHTRLPEVAFKEYVRDDIVLPEEPNRKLNPKRETVSFEEPTAVSHSLSGSGGNKFTRSPEIRSRSLEERDVLGMDNSKSKNLAFQPQVTLVPEGAACCPVEGATTGARRKGNLSESTVSAYATPTTSRTNSEDIQQTLRWPKRMTQGTLRTNMRIPKVESFDSRDLLGGYGNTLRPTVAKSYSFGGYTATCTSHEANAAAMRGGETPVNNGAQGVYQQHNVNNQHQGGQNYGTRFLSKQDSNSSSISISRSSPTSSGYKSQHSAAPSPTPVPSNSRSVPLRTPAAACNSTGSNIESPNAGGYSNQEWNRVNAAVGGASATTPEIVTPPTSSNATLLWAVTSLDDVPAGSILINPQTGQPFYNSDGSAYRYDPHLPLPFQVETNVNSNSDAMGEIEQAESYESYDRPEVVVKAEDNNEGSSMSSVPMYPAWPQQCYESPISPTLATSYVNQPQAYFGPEFASFHPANGAAAAASNAQANGYFVGPTVNSSAHPFDDQMKGNCVAVPVAHGHGYVLYQACLAPSGDNGASIDANDLYSAMKNLSLRPIGGIPPMSYPLAENLTHHQVELASTNGPYIATVPIRPANGIPNGKMQAPCNNLPPRSGSTPPTVVTSAATASLTSNAYLASMRAQSNSQMIHHQMQQPYNGTANVAAYPSMVYPLVNTTAHSQGGRQHYFPSSLVQHQFNNAAHQYVSSPWSLVTQASSGTNRGTPERETNNPVSLEMPSNRMVAAAPHSPNRVSCLYGPTLPTPFLTAGECGAIRQSSTVGLHRQFSLPTPAPPAMYTLRPRIQQQQQTSFSGSSLPRPATSIQNQPAGVLSFNSSSRHVSRTRRQVFRPHAAPAGFTVTDPSSVMQSHSSSPVQQFPSPTS